MILHHVVTVCIKPDTLFKHEANDPFEFLQRKTKLVAVFMRSQALELLFILLKHHTSLILNEY